jgi:TetR/AcrR family transcriptional regulator, transcriptional repressor for nem operon
MAASRTPDEPRTADRILDVAERLVQTRGFNRFSYADIAAELGITTASLHYHFPSKAQLGRSLIIRYAERFSGSLTRIDHDLPDARAKLEAYTRLYADVVRNERMCLCGILATEYETLPTPMRDAVISFFDANEKWLAEVLTQGTADKALTFTGSVEATARTILGTLEGAMLVARPYSDATRFDTITQRLLASLTE